MIRYFFTLIFAFVILFAKAQKSPSKIELIHANTLEGDDALGKDVRRLLGDVVFKQENTFMYCDSAYLYSATNSMDAFGNVRIEQGDTISLTGDILKYNGNSRQARLLNNIVFSDRKMTLISQNLNYNLDTGIADYIEGGQIVDGTDTLTSRFGTYFSNQKKLAFKKDVVLKHPGHRMETDTLVYGTVSKVAEFYGPCYIRSNDSSVIYCENGWYNTATDKAFFSKNAFVQNKNQILKGDSMFFDNNTSAGEAFKNVSITDTTEKVVVNSDYGNYNGEKGFSFMTGNLLMTKMFEKDSLFMHGDSLISLFDSTGKAISYAVYHNVRMYKKDLQATCDSLIYTAADSLLFLYHNPVLWNEVNQLTADTISMLISSEGIRKLFLNQAAFITSKEDSIRFNQLRGKTMVGYFEDNMLSKIAVFGNGQSIYFARNKKNELTGVNRADCSNMIIIIKDSKISKLKLIEKPDATFYPIGELSASELMLKGFNWQENKRPVDKNDIFRKN
ncbi:MAG: hypothetical protein JST71_10200 [Bacteroidetes bacterium]|nr:hypothetical protein [Bacteroidota bacterium]